jgi:hypothetical protein
MQSWVIDAITQILKGSLPMRCRGRMEDILYTTYKSSAGISSLWHNTQLQLEGELMNEKICLPLN